MLTFCVCCTGGIFAPGRASNRAFASIGHTGKLNIAELNMLCYFHYDTFTTKVPYYDKIQNVESKIDHITASARAHEYQGAEESARGHISMNGFTDKGVEHAI